MDSDHRSLGLLNMCTKFTRRAIFSDFRLSTRTGCLGIAVLGLHALTATLWQLLVTRRVILSWTNTPEYIMLGAGSPSLTTAYPNTCAGIAAKGALSGVIMLKETLPNTNSPDPSHLTVTARDNKEARTASTQVPADPIPPHLEIVAWDGVDRTGRVNVKHTKKKYGFDGGRGGGMKLGKM